MQHQASSRDQTHLHNRKGSGAEDAKKWCPEQQGGCEVLAEPFVTHERELTGMNNIGGELRGEGTLKPMAMQAVPCHLLENSLVVPGEQNPGFPQLQSERYNGKKAGR